jgi:hypothetical protein
MILTGETEVLGEKHYTVWVVDGWMSMEQWWNDTDRGNWSIGRKTLYSVGGRWMDEYGAMVEWYWQGKLKYWEREKYMSPCLAPSTLPSRSQQSPVSISPLLILVTSPSHLILLHSISLMTSGQHCKSRSLLTPNPTVSCYLLQIHKVSPDALLSSPNTIPTFFPHCQTDRQTHKTATR